MIAAFYTEHNIKLLLTVIELYNKILVDAK